MAYDSIDQCVVLFGGVNSSSGVLGDTWEYAAGTWTQLDPELSPLMRSGMTLVDDSSDPTVGGLLMFGGAYTVTNRSGATLTTYLDDTWVFSHSAWTERHPAVSPPARAYYSMAYDRYTNGVILFGGTNGTDLSDTWMFIDGSWSRLDPTSVPPGRTGAALALSPSEHSLLLFGGRNSSEALLADTWSLAQGNWTELHPTVAPVARERAGAVTLPNGSVAVFGGGAGGPETLMNDLWIFAGGQWSRVSPLRSPSARWGAVFTEDVVDGYALLFGGAGNSGTLADGWAYDVVGITAVATPPEGTAPLSVYFTTSLPQGAGAFSYEWHFSDGATSHMSSYGRLYARAGRFDASVTVTDELGLQDTVQLPAVEVFIRTTATATPLNGSVPLAVQFTAVASNGTAPYAYLWSFGDGNHSSAPNASHTYRAVGTFPATLAVTDANGANGSYGFVVNVTAPATAGSPGPPWTGIAAALAGVIVVGVGVGIFLRRRRYRRVSAAPE
jgi:PKD repeat protein